MLLQKMIYRTHLTTCHQEQESMHLIGCPTCGRPVKVRSQWFDIELACSHCSGTFIVTELMDGSKQARSTTASKPQTENHQLVVKAGCCSRERTTPSTRLQSQPDAQVRRPVAFLIEPRGEVYARLAGDLVEAGYRPVRAMSVTDGLKACGKYRPSLVLTNITLCGQAAWRMAPKMAMLDSNTRVWLYDHQVEVHDHAMADILGIEQLIEYRGDLFRLSSHVREALGVHGCKNTNAGRASVN